MQVQDRGQAVGSPRHLFALGEVATLGMWVCVCEARRGYVGRVTPAGWLQSEWQPWALRSVCLAAQRAAQRPCRVLLSLLFAFPPGGFSVASGILHLNSSEKSSGFLHLFWVLHQFCVISAGY